jgi:hypothetical protein
MYTVSEARTNDHKYEHYMSFLQFHYNYITIGLLVEINFRLRLSTVVLESDNVLLRYPSTDHIHHVHHVHQRGTVHMSQVLPIQVLNGSNVA